MIQEKDPPFFWGVSISGYQHEGGYNAPSKPLNNWLSWERKKRVEISDKAVDFWNLYEEDLDRCKEIGLNSFRFSIEWARIQPTFNPKDRSEPEIDGPALRHYLKIIQACHDRNIEPFICLLHFTHPHWLGPDIWLNDKTINIFTNTYFKTITWLNDQLSQNGYPAIQYFLTINEPNILASMTYISGDFPSATARSIPIAAQAFKNLTKAHILAYRGLHQLYREHPEWNATPFISFNNFCNELYWMDKAMVDILAAPSLGVKRQDCYNWLHERYREHGKRFMDMKLFFHKNIPYFLGQFMKMYHHYVGHHFVKDDYLADLMDLLYQKPDERPFDFISFDYYAPFAAYTFRLPRLEDLQRKPKNLLDQLFNTITSKCWDWQVLPDGLRFFVDIYAKDYPHTPILIAENGMALLKLPSKRKPFRHDNLTRSEFLIKHINLIHDLRSEGKPLMGYLHWSLTDNYEWGSYAPRFGLYHVDLQDPKLRRHAQDALGDNPSATYAKLIKNNP
ncbi:MAG: family 1 glycosylhydrolase [Verrucomicrobiota bacterium]